MTYHNGPVQHTQKIFTVFWFPTGNTIPAGYQTTINQFVQDLNGTPYYTIASQYSDTTGNIDTAVLYGGTWLDTTNAFPSSTLSYSDLLAEINRAKVANGWTSDANTYFQVYTPTGIGTTLGSNFCGLHWFANPAIGQILFPQSGCFPGPPYPNNQVVDSAINTSAHEIMETVTDPQGNAWFLGDASGEIGDLCNFNFGSRAIDGSNVTLSGHPYIIQTEWSNAGSACRLSLAVAPPNNNFANAQVLSGNSGSITGTNSGATKESGEPNHGGNAGGASIWYQWQAPASGTATIDTVGSNFDTTLGVYTGSSVSTLTTIASNDDDTGAGVLTSKVTFSAVSGTVYRIAVDGFDAATGNVTLNWSLGVVTPLRIDSVSPLAGRTTGGQLIRFTGAFGGLSTVKLGGVTASWFYTNGSSDTSAITVTTPAHAVGAVQIDLTPTSGSLVSKANAFVYLPTVFTDDTLMVGQTTAKAQHILELRQAVDAMRAVAGLSGAPWTDPGLAASGTIKAAHILDLRTFLNDAATRLGYSTSGYTDPSLTTGFTIKRVHIEELRQRIRVIAG